MNRKSNILKKILSALFWFLSIPVWAQNIQPCGTAQPTSQQFEDWIQIKITELKNNPVSSRSLVTIPVVFHIIHGGETVGTAANIGNEAIYSQLDVLTEDFRKMSGTSGHNTHPDGADCEIEFCLGGIDRINYHTKGWNINPPDTIPRTYIETIIKPQSIWDPNSYLNVWVFPTGPSGASGYATFPQSSSISYPNNFSYGTATTDGIAIYYKQVGRVGNFYPTGVNPVLGGTEIVGRILTHEVGHFFGLLHTFTGGCNIFGTNGDYCNDVPSCEAPPQGFNPCSDANCFFSNRMYQNYMDYTIETCYNIFTHDQKDRISAVLANSPRRSSLTFGASCCDENFAIISVLSNYGGNALPCSGSCVGRLSAVGTGGVQPYTYKWSTGATTQIISGLCAGTYMVTMTDSKGCPATVSYTINNPTGTSGPNANAGSDVTIQAGASTTLQGLGGGTYSWGPSSSLSNPNVWNPVASPSSTTTYTLTVTDGNGCADTDPVIVTVQGGGGGAPPNDNPCSATLLTVGSVCNYVTGTNLNATNTTSPATPSMCTSSSTSGSSSGGYSGGDVWFKAVVPSSGQLIINTGIQSSVYDLVLGIYTGGSCSSLSQVACNDDRIPGSNYMPYLYITSLTPGQTVYIRVWEFNNDRSGNFGICVQDPGGSSGSNDPDLTISINSISTINPNTGGNVTLNMTVTNSGSVSVNSAFTARIALSTDASLNYSTDVQLAGSTQTISSLGSGASTTFSKTITIPSSTANGNYYLIAEVDELNDQIDESYENNNTAPRSITVGTISSNEVDLDNYNETVTPSTGLAPGMQFNVACDVRNLGNTSASGARLGYFFSTNTSYNPGTDIYLGDDALGTLASGGSSSENENFYLPNMSSTGTKYILFVSDYQNVTADIDLSNNVSYKPITVTTTTPARPDYICNLFELKLNNAIISPDSVIPYGNLRIAIHSTNIGNLSSGIASRMKTVLSDDATLDANDFHINYNSDPSGLTIGENDTNYASHIIDGIDLGPKYLITQVDYDNTIVERNENNNKCIFPIKVIADTFQLPDIIVSLTGITPYSSKLGDTLLVSGYVTNQGIGPVVNDFYIDFYLSYDDIYQGSTIEISDLLGGFRMYPILNVGDTVFFTKPIFTQMATQVGSYYIIAVADDQKDIAEITKQNNVSAIPIELQSVACYYNAERQIDTISYLAGSNTTNNVYTEENCVWTVSENSPWLSATNVPQLGNGTLAYYYQKNTFPYPRVDSIMFMGHKFTVYQNRCPITPASLGVDVTICNSTTLQGQIDTTQTFFTWSTGSTNSSIQVSTTGTYRVTVSNANGCITSDTIQVTISNRSTAPISVTPSQNPVCDGNSVLLTQNGGTLGQAYEWKWYSGSCGGSLVGTGGQLFVSPNGTSQYFVRAEGCDTTACTLITITTLSLPAIDAGIDVTINEGDTTLLTASGGIRYLWSTGDTTAATSVSPIATSYFYVRGSDNNGCETIDSVLITLVHNCSNLVASITPAGATSFCSGANVTLTANVGMASYLWSNGDTAQSITVSQSGNFFVAITDSFSCPATSQSISITSNALPYADAGIDQAVCIGSSVAIGVPQTPGYTYSWSPSTTLNNSQMAMPSATPTAQTTYVVTVTNSFGCTATDQTSISINPLPNVTANATANAVCNGASITLTGGGASTYTWSNGVIDGVAFIPSATVTYTVTGIDANGCQNTATNLVSILATPTASISYNNNGNTYNFSSNIQGNATNYSWNFGDSDTSILENPLHTYSQVGTFTVTLTVTNICGSNTYKQTININPNCTYILSQNAVVADSNGTSQAITVTCGVSCLWNVNIGNCSWLSVAPSNGAGLNSFTITIPATTDTFVKQCTLTVEGQAISVTQYGKQGSVSCAPIDTSVQVNGGCDLAAATISGATYQWYKNGGQISNATSQYHTATQNGYYHVKIALSNCTYQSSDHYLACDTTTEIDESAILNLKVYPNPTDGTFIISGETKNGTQLSVNLYDMLGQIVYSKNIASKGPLISEEIRVANLSLGIYHLQLLIDKQSYYQKLLVK